MKRRWSRILVFLAILSILVIGSVAAVLHVREHLVRNHVQRILDKVQHLEIGVSHTCEVELELRKEWGSHVSVEGRCDDPDHFFLAIHAQHPPFLSPICHERQLSRAAFLFVRGLCWSLQGVSGRTFVLDSWLKGKNGVVSHKSATVFVVVPDESGEELPAVISAIATAPQLPRVFPGQSDFQQDKQQAILHPSYRVYVNTARSNADYQPGGRVFYITAWVAPDAERSDSERLFGFALSCITQIHPCSRQDIMPAAYAQYEQDARRFQAPPAK